jgi:hypothetical protein
MKITAGFKSEKDAYGRLTDIESIEQLADIITKENYSLGIFKKNHRSKEDFIKAWAIGLDFDGGYSIDQAKTDFVDYTHIIAPSKSHRKEKNGVVSDRFRVILFLTRAIDDCDTFEQTWHWLKERWPDTDKACKDASRFWFPSTEIVSIRKGGKKLDPVEVIAAELAPTEFDRAPILRHGELGKPTMKFLLEGAASGGRNHATTRAAKDFQQNLYTVDEAIDQIVKALHFNGTIACDFTEQEVITTIRSAYNSEAKHDPRIKETAFNLKRIGELYKDTEGAQIEWLVDGLLQVGGVSLLSADPKAGKSVIARQLCSNVVHGTPFFGKTTKQGVCHYYGIEEHPMILARSFQRLGMEPEADLFVHAGDPLADANLFAEFAESIERTKPVLAVIDTAFDLLEVESENNYREVKKAFKKVRKVARENGTHIMLVHHNSKPQKDFRQRGNHAVLGSTAISAGVDSIIIVEMDGRQRLISTSGREVDQWQQRFLDWDDKTKTYSLGKEREDYE